ACRAVLGNPDNSGNLAVAELERGLVAVQVNQRRLVGAFADAQARRVGWQLAARVAEADVRHARDFGHAIRRDQSDVLAAYLDLVREALPRRERRAANQCQDDQWGYVLHGTFTATLGSMWCSMPQL